MIPMSCPNCGSQGEVPLDRLNSRMKCRKCGTMFYMDQTGSIVLGDPNDPKTKRRNRRADSGPAVQVDLDVAKMVRDIPKPVKLGALVLAVVAALGYGVSTLLASMGLPEDVEGRTKYVGELFVDGKLDELRAMATPGTAEDLAKWQETMRPQLAYDGPRRDRDDVASTAAVMGSGETSAQSFVSLMVTGAPPLPPGTAVVTEGPQNYLTLSLFWAKQDGQWLVDGSQTLKEALKPKPASRSTRSRAGGRAPR